MRLVKKRFIISRFLPLMAGPGVAWRRQLSGQQIGRQMPSCIFSQHAQTNETGGAKENKTQHQWYPSMGAVDSASALLSGRNFFASSKMMKRSPCRQRLSPLMRPWNA
jgi:hypothetical protein